MSVFIWIGKRLCRNSSYLIYSAEEVDLDGGALDKITATQAASTQNI